MNKFLIVCLNIIYFPYLLVISILFELFVPIYLIVFKLLRKGRLDDAFRIHNWKYGRYMVKASWPYLRCKVSGADNIPEKGPYVFALNHRSSLDIFFSSLVPVANQVVIVRSWVFDLKVFGWAMRLAKYLNIDKTSVDELRRTGKELTARNVSFQFYPEAHRSRDGKLGRFRTGAFLIAAENNLPIIPVCMTGTDDFASYEFPYINPAKIHVVILPPVYPSSFDSEQRPLKIRKHVAKIFREYFKE